MFVGDGGAGFGAHGVDRRTNFATTLVAIIGARLRFGAVDQRPRGAHLDCAAVAPLFIPGAARGPVRQRRLGALAYGIAAAPGEMVAI